MSHVNNGECPKCLEIINKYPGFHVELLAWFKAFQKNHPEAHTSCAGRGQIDQDALFQRNATRARWGQSAHNHNCALDLFCMIPGSSNIYEPSWFHNILAPNMPQWVDWYGRPGAPFYELPHVEVHDWPSLHLPLVE